MCSGFRNAHAKEQSRIGRIPATILLICVVALAILRDSAENPHGDRERESQEQKARGEPQPTVGYFLPPLWPSPPLLPLPPPCSVGGPPLAFAGAAGAFLACPGAGAW